MTVRPKAQPKANEPTGTIENVPSPYKPNQPMPNLPGLPEAITGAITVSLGVKATNMLSGDKVPDYTPVRYNDVTLNSEMKAEIQKLAQYRQINGFPEAAKDTKAGTIASTTIEGKTFYGHSTVNERTVLGKDSFALRKKLFDDLKDAGYLQNDLRHNDQRLNFLYHAETGTILEAKEKLGSLEGKDLVIYVDRQPCDPCYNHLPKVAEFYGINSITIISSNPDEKDQIVVVIKNGVK